MMLIDHGLGGNEAPVPSVWGPNSSCERAAVASGESYRQDPGVSASRGKEGTGR
jgi:hypothetical protein